MTPLVPDPPDWIRVAHDIDWAVTHALAIVHVGQSGTLLAAPGADRGSLVTLTWGERGLAPGGLQIPVSAAAGLVTRLSQARAQGALVDLSPWSDLPADRLVNVDLHLPDTGIDTTAVNHLADLLSGHPDRPGADDDAMDPRRQRALSPALAHAILIGDAAGACALAQRLIGAGPGATPAGDDVLIGILAGVQLAAGAGLVPPAAQRADRQVRRIVHMALDRTTAASAHDLAAALAGSFSEHLLHLAVALGDPQTVTPAYRAACIWGATSGIDLLHGLVGAAAESLGHGPALARATA